MKYYANDKFSCVISCFDELKKRNFLLRVIEQSHMENKQVQEDLLSYSLNPQNKQMISNWFIISLKNNEQKGIITNTYVVQELVYKEYCDYLTTLSNLQINDLQQLNKNHHLVSSIHYQLKVAPEALKSQFHQLQYSTAEYRQNNINKINNQDVQLTLAQISQSLQKCINLKTLNLNVSLQFIDSISLSKLTAAISKCQRLKKLVLNLSQNYIDDTGVHNIGQCIIKCSSLEVLQLNLFKCKIGQQNSSELEKYISQCTNLIFLGLNLEKNDIKSLSRRGFLFVNLTKLKGIDLDFSNNQEVLLIAEQERYARKKQIQILECFEQLQCLRYIKFKSWIEITSAEKNQLIRKMKRLVSLSLVQDNSFY